jgi:hypothetical protein
MEHSLAVRAFNATSILVDRIKKTSKNAGNVILFNYVVENVLEYLSGKLNARLFSLFIC